MTRGPQQPQHHVVSDSRVFGSGEYIKGRNRSAASTISFVDPHTCRRPARQIAMALGHWDDA